MSASETRSGTNWVDVAFDLLSESRRRRLLYHFLESEYDTVETLSRRIAAWEAEVEPRKVSEDDRERVAIALVHNHLPHLAQHGVVEYDARSGDVVRADGFDDLRPLIECARDLEPVGEVSEPSRLSVLYSDPSRTPASPEDD